MRLVSTVLTVFGVFGLSLAHAQDCKNRIIFLPQTHAADQMTSLRESDESLYRVASSQLKVANYIERFPGVDVFSEQMTKSDISWGDIPADKRTALHRMINDVFPKGLPESVDELTRTQKEKLSNNGGEFVQMMRGRLSRIHRVVEDEGELRQIMNPIATWFRNNPGRSDYPLAVGQLVYGAREERALEQVKNYFSSNLTKKDAILIFGANHSFNFYPDKFPPECIVIPPEFREDWTGRWRAGPQGFPAYKKNSYEKPPSTSAVR